MIEEIKTLVGRHLPGYAVRTLVKLGEGLDNLAYEVNGNLIVRSSKEVDPEMTRREVEVLRAIVECGTLPVPEVVFADAEAGVIAYAKLPGTPLQTALTTDVSKLAAPLGEFLGSVHRAVTSVPEDVAPLAEWLAEATENYEVAAGHIPATARRTVERFLNVTPPAEPEKLVLCHNDLGSEHILVNGDTITGVIDWTDAAVTDPAVDFALIFRDLGPEVFELSLAHYPGEIVRERAVFYARCALLEDLAYGIRNPSARRYEELGLRHLEWTFAR
ncbi:aminoglycoside phosphotransferase family protein [Spongiactinospora rosea]|uniref:Aminoglycoside phosphotransferase family protein n=1 Tax=Spongiactinospora rosea TaxID=2248750 RepID=A0A366LP48_9ACTN|nr:phosphotransferase [Spongiactinospora rosea]RBQ15420.1 aminoglycoside phosphotransferase family protein [Spongiactinospora rosea]